MKKHFDPRMHSAEHILNQTMVRIFDCSRSFSAHLEKKKSKCDYHFERDITPDERNMIEAKVNEVIENDMVVREELLDKEDTGMEYDLSRLPEEAGDTIRIIRIGDYDACPCSGEHVRSTREIDSFRIASTSHDNGVLRIRFKLGGLKRDSHQS
jgi:Ser-tRNA(Ala) deacylase AlaX